MDRFIDGCISHGRAMCFILAMVFILGIGAYTSIPKEVNPDIQIPIIYVSLRHEGISPLDAERLLIRPMEQELRSIEGIKEMSASASEGHASVTLEFYDGFDSDRALADVREKVDIAKVELPEETDEPTVNEVNLSRFPVLNVILTGEVPDHTMMASARYLRDQIKEVTQVLDVDIAGEREDMVEIIVDPMMLQSYRLTVNDLASIATGFNQLVASGNLESDHGRFSVKIPGLLEDAEDILNLPLKSQGDAVVRVRDIAKLKKSFKDRKAYARVNGGNAVVLEVSKRTGTNIINTIDAVKAVVQKEQAYLPPNIELSFSQDQSTTIHEMLADLENNIILAVLLVMVVILYFVGFQSSIFIAIAIPGAFLMGVLALSWLGYTMNIVVLFSLILSVGMLVDAAIVVCEMADKNISKGDSPKLAFSKAAKYMKLPIIASTATTLVVFFPLLFWPGVGQFMKYLPITLIMTLTGSLIMAIIIIPSLGAMFGRQRRDGTSNEELKDNSNHPLYDAYAIVLTSILKRPKLLLVSVFVLLISVFYLFGSYGRGVEFFPNVEPERSQLQILARGNLALSEKNAIAKEVEALIEPLENEIKVFYNRVGALGDGGNRDVSEDTIAVIMLEYEHWKKRRKASAIHEDIRQRIAHLPGIYTNIVAERAGPASDKPIEIELTSRNVDLLGPTLKKVVDAMNSIDGITDIEDNRSIPQIEYTLELDRALAKLFEADVATIGSFVKFITNGLIATTYRPDESDQEVDIAIRFPEEYRNFSTLDGLKVQTNRGAIPVSNMVERYANPRVSMIHRSNGYRSLTIKAGIEEGVLADAMIKQLTQQFTSMDIDPSVFVRFKGDDEEQKESMAFLSKAFIVALGAMALILLIQFNSFYHVVVVLSAVFLSIVGVLLALLLTNQAFGIVMCGMGVIALSGIVVNNNIIFIDTFQKLRAAGNDVHQALIETGKQRLRPILLTAGTTVLGLLPMVLGMNISFTQGVVSFGAPSSQWWTQLSSAIVGGLTFATLLTLFITPSLLLIGEQWFGSSSYKLLSKLFGASGRRTDC